MKRILIIVLALALLFSMAACKNEDSTVTDINESPDTVVTEEVSVEDAANAYFAEYPGSRIVTWEDVLALLDAGEEPFILSIRQQDVYDAGHVEGAYLASWGTDLAEKVAMLPTDEKVYVYCYTGQTAGQTVALLNMLGVDAVSIKSGFNSGLMNIEGYETYLSTEANELPDANAEFSNEVLAFVQNYFNAIPESGSNILPSDQVDALVQSGDITVVDIRSADDFAAGHIEGAVNLPFGENMQLGFADLPEGKLAVTCYSGQTAGQTVAIMRALGYDAVSLKSGMNFGWTPYVKSTAANAYFSEYPGSRIITWDAVAEKIDAGEELFILSIRQQDVYDEGHVAGAYLASWGTDLAEKIAMLPTDETVYVYCYSGQTAGQTIALMNMLGIEAVSIKSGFNGISGTEGYEAYLETEANELPDAGAEFDAVLLNSVKAYFNAIPEAGSNIMPAEDVFNAVAEESVTVVDIRSAEDFAAGHIVGAINVPFGANMHESFADLPSGKLVVACYSGQTAGQTVAVLRQLGYDAVSLKGGMGGWTTAEMPVVTD